MNEETFAWFVGIDWGSEKHQVCVLDQQGAVVGERSFPHSGAGLAELGDWLLAVAGAATAVAVAIEVPHGPVVDSLIDRGFMVHSINPKQLDRLRDRFSVAGAKDDRRDGYVLANRVRTDRRMLLTCGSSNCVRGRALPGNSASAGSAHTSCVKTQAA